MGVNPAYDTTAGPGMLIVEEHVRGVAHAKAPLKVFLFSGCTPTNAALKEAMKGENQLASTETVEEGDSNIMNIYIAPCKVQVELILPLVLSVKMFSFMP